MTANADNLVWIDLEMTGLDPEKDRIIEIALIVTDTNLHVLAEAPVYAIHQSDELLNQMDEWNTKTHNASGLVKRVQESTISEEIAEDLMISFLENYVPVGKSPLCGNSIWQDRRFLAKFMPKLEQYFHYRIVDVSTLKELAQRWAPKIYNGIQKQSSHTALEDIRESVIELKYYRDNFLRIPTE